MQSSRQVAKPSTQCFQRKVCYDCLPSRRIMSGSREAVFIVDREWMIVHASSSSAKMFGRSQGALLRSSIFSLLPERVRGSQQELWASTPEGRDSLRVDALGQKAGEEFPLKVEVAHVPEGNGLRCVVLRDQRTSSRQSQKMEALGLLAGGVAHDFNNALTAIIGFATGVRDQLATDSPLRDDMDEVLNAADSASQLTSQLLSFSRQRPVQSSVIEVNRSIVDLQSLLRRTLPVSIEIELQVHEQDVYVRFELSELHQILINLASNARDVMTEGGKLIVGITTEQVSANDGLRDGEYAVVTVRDTGEGIPKDLLSKIFDPFFSTKGEEGTGLGLSTCFGLARQAAGTLMVESVPGQGTTFSLYIPTCSVAPSRSLTTTQGLRLRRDYGSALVVEDQSSVRKYLVRTLEKMGLTVCEVSSAEEALLAYEEMIPAPELLVSDVMLPGKSGTALADLLIGKESELRVLLISGHIAPGAGSDTLSAANTQFLGKPFTVKQLRRAVEDLLNPPQRLGGHIVVTAVAPEQQKEIMGLLVDVELEIVSFQQTTETIEHLKLSQTHPSLLCVSAELPQEELRSLFDFIRRESGSLGLPVLVFESETRSFDADSFGGDSTGNMAVLHQAPTREDLREALGALGLGLATT